jgi:hypothetical protein
MKLLHRSMGMLVTATLGMVVLSAAQAKVFTVGADSSCSHRSLDQAIRAARTSPGRDEIRLARNIVQESTLAHDLDADITLNGGYSNCADTVALGVTRIRLLGRVDTDWLAQHAHGAGLRFESKGAQAPAPATRGVLMAQ